MFHYSGIEISLIYESVNGGKCLSESNFGFDHLQQGHQDSSSSSLHPALFLSYVLGTNSFDIGPWYPVGRRIRWQLWVEIAKNAVLVAVSLLSSTFISDLPIPAILC